MLKIKAYDLKKDLKVTSPYKKGLQRTGALHGIKANYTKGDQSLENGGLLTKR